MESWQEFEARAREAIGKKFRAKCVKKVGLRITGGGNHEFDIYAKGKAIGGATTAKYRNRSGSSNTAGRDRALAEILWLSLSPGLEKRVLVARDRELACWLATTGVGKPYKVEVFWLNARNRLVECR